MTQEYDTQKGHGQDMDTPTIACYYKETDPMKRKKLLEKSVEEGQTPEEDAIRRELWEIRYSEPSEAEKNSRADGFMRLWMSLEYNRKSVGSLFRWKGARKEVTGILKKLKFSEFQEKSPLHKELLYRECCHMVRTYITLCAQDKTYTSLAFGLMSLSNEQTDAKLRQDIQETAIDLPQAMRMEEELALVTRAAKEVYQEYFSGEDEHE